MEFKEILKKLIETLSRFYFKWMLDVKGFYDKSASFYDIAHHFQTMYADNTHRLAVANNAELKDGALVLDVGTGTSLAAICAINSTYPKKKIRVIGIDLSNQMLQKSRKNQKKFHIKNQILNINCDARCLPLRRDIFDTIISVYGIGGVQTQLKRLFLELVTISKDEAVISLGEMTTPPQEKGLLKRKLHELIIEPFINCVWHFKDLNLPNLFKAFNIRIIKRRYYDTHYLGSMTLIVGKLNDISKKRHFK